MVNYFILSINTEPSGKRKMDFFSKEIGHVENFTGTKEMKKGDGVLFYINNTSSLKGGVFGLGIVIEDAKKGLSIDGLKEEQRVDVQIRQISDTPLITIEDLIPNVVGRIMTVQKLKRDLTRAEQLFSELLG